MITGSLPSNRTVVAVSGDCSLLPPRSLPSWSANHSATRSYARARSAGPMACRSLANCSVSTNNSTYFTPYTSSHPAGGMAHPLCLVLQLRHPSHHLVRSHVLHVRRNRPSMSERVHDVTVPVAVELVLRGTLKRRAELHGARDDLVHVLDIDEQERWGAGNAAGRRCRGPPFGVLILDDDDRITDLDLGVGDRPVGPGKAHAFGRVKHVGIEFDGPDATVDD